jgi:hypothetical protein
LLHAGTLEISPSCRAQTLGTPACNCGRRRAISTVNGHNIGGYPIEELAQPFHCSTTRCLKTPDRPKTIEGYGRQAAWGGRPGEQTGCFFSE